MTVGHHHVQASVQVEIGQRSTPADPRPALGGQPPRVGHFGKQAVPQVLVKRIVFVGKIGHQQFKFAIAVRVARRDSHAGLLIAFIVIGDTRALRCVLECAVAPVEEQGIRMQVVSHVQVDRSVGVQVRGNDALGAPRSISHSNRLRYVRERAVALVAIQNIPLRPHRVRAAEDPDAARSIAAKRVCVPCPFCIIADIQIKQPVVIVVQHAGAGGPAGIVDARRADRLECSVALVAIQHVGSVASDVDIGESVGIKVAHGDSGAITGVVQPALCAAVRETPIALIAIQAVRRFPPLWIDRKGRAGGEVQVDASVQIIIEGRQPAAVRRRKRFFVRGARVMHEIDAGLPSNRHEPRIRDGG